MTITDEKLREAVKSIRAAYYQLRYSQTPVDTIEAALAELETIKPAYTELLEQYQDLAAGAVIKMPEGEAAELNAKLTGELVAANAELETLRAANTWQPIETAPRDGTMILVYLPYHGGWVGQTFWKVETPALQYWYADGGEMCPTHWMPLPTPPKEDSHD